MDSTLLIASSRAAVAMVYTIHKMVRL